MAGELGWRDLTRSEREREYSPSSCVGGDIQPFLDDYATSSERARRWCASNGHVIHEVSYGPASSQTMDLVTPGTDRPHPVLVYIHGGYWQLLSKRESFFAAIDFLSRGIGFVAVDYTLAPAATLDDIVAECRTAVAHLHSSVERFGLDPDRIFLAGSSAGAHLAAMTALDPGRAGPTAGVVLVSGIYELEPLIGTTINDALQLDLAAVERNSPMRCRLEGFPPAVVAWGDNETAQFQRQSRMFSQLLTEAGTASTEIEISGRNHFDVIMDVGREQTPLGRAASDLIEGAEADHGPH